jgi:hypothetical protein
MNIYLPGVYFTDSTRQTVKGLPENVTLNGFYTNESLTTAANSGNHNTPSGDKFIRLYGYANSNNIMLTYSAYISFTVT